MSLARFARFSEILCHKTCRSPSLVSARHLNANRASIAKTARPIFARQYPTTVVLQDGSTINIQYKEPRRIIKLPVDLSTLSEEERQLRLERRKPKKKIKVIEEMEDSFDVTSYSHLWKK